MSEIKFDTFVSSAERIKGERERRIANAQRILTFGVGYLDTALGGIFPNDLVLIGAKTGVGKTQLATCIAMANAQAGRRVHYFALEAEQDEIERRIKFALLSNMAREEGHPLYRRMQYLDWYAARVDIDARRYEQRVQEEFDARFKTLHTFYRTGDFYGETFHRLALSVQDQTDLIIVDHLLYIDTQDPNENRGYKLIVKQVRDAALSMGKPVILLSHIRKGDARSQSLVPDIEDFHGTSDIPKISTKALMLAPARDQPACEPGKLPTYISPVKCRVDGSRCRYVGLVDYDARTGTYENEFVLGQIEGNEFRPLAEEKLPYWAQPRSEEGMF